MAHRLIVPVVLEPNVPLPGFIAQAKHLRAYENWQSTFANFNEFVDTQATEAAQRQ